MDNNNHKYQVFYNKVKANYPDIAREMEAEFPSMEKHQILAAHNAFCSEKGVDHVMNANTETKQLFMAVFLYIFDPDYLEGYKKKVRTGLRIQLASILNVKEGIVSYNVNNIKTQIMFYKQFREDIVNLAESIIDKIF